MTKINIVLDNIPRDVNRAISNAIKATGLPVIGTEAQLMVRSEPGRTWIKPADKSACIAYG